MRMEVRVVEWWKLRKANMMGRRREGGRSELELN